MSFQNSADEAYDPYGTLNKNKKLQLLKMQRFQSQAVGVKQTESSQNVATPMIRHRLSSITAPEKTLRELVREKITSSKYWSSVFTHLSIKFCLTYSNVAGHYLTQNELI